MGYRQRIETAVRALFELDRENEKKIEEAFGSASGVIIDFLNQEGSGSIVLDLIGIPQDNSCDYDFNTVTDEVPEGHFCRDGFLHLWYSEAEDAQEFIDYCYSALKEFAENNITFTTPKEPHADSQTNSRENRN